MSANEKAVNRTIHGAPHGVQDFQGEAPLKGIIFNLLEEVVTETYGEQVWDTLLDSTGLAGSYTSLGQYPDSQLGTLVQAASLALDVPPREMLRWFGEAAMPILARRYPAFFSMHHATRPFVLSVNHIIHPEVLKLYPGADLPVFDFADGPEGTLVMGYRSPRKLCALAQGFVEGAAAHYHECVTVEHLACMHDGDPECRLRIAFSPDRT
jgi:Haem-NO-binding